MNLKRLKNYLVLTLLALVGISASAVTSASSISGKKQTLYSSSSHKTTPYRIPAIAVMSNNEILAISDYRPGGRDVGGGDVDIYAKFGTIAANGSYSWTPSSNDPINASDKVLVANGPGSGYGYGDAAVVADRESGKVLVMCVGGNTAYTSTTTSSDYRSYSIVSSDYGRTWTMTNQTSTFKGSEAIFKNNNSSVGSQVQGMFFASGRLLQSKRVKVDNYYRVYGAMLVRIDGSSYNYVVYTDDFGTTWKQLGSSYCVSSADEAKLEELPNGQIVISSRAAGSRHYNVFTFTNETNATGSWGTQQTYKFANSNACNGELLLYEGVKNSKGETKTILLQSLPVGTKSGYQRSNVSVYYKEIDPNTTYTPSQMASGWTKGIEVDDAESAYSTMDILPNGEIGFMYEDEYFSSNSNDNYKYGSAPGGTANIVYVPLTVSEITGGAYTLETEEKPVVETVATPVFTPNGGEIEAGSAISISCATVGATIYYTTNGTTPTASSTKYTGAFTLTSDATVKAIAVKTDWNNSEIATASFTIKQEVVEPTVNKPEAGKKYRFVNVQANKTKYYFSYTATNGLMLSSNEANATTYTCGNGTKSGTYTFQSNDGNYLIWTGRGLSNYKGENSALGYLSIYSSTWCDFTIEEMVSGGSVTSSFSETYYTIKGKRTAASGSAEDVYFVIKSDMTFNGATAPFFDTNYSSAFLIEEVAEESVVETVATPTFTPNGGEIEAGTKIAISCATEGATIYYSINGSEPTTVYSAPFELTEAATVKAVAKKNGWNNSATAQASFTIKEEVVVETVATPVITPNGGEIEAGTKVAISCATEGATIYYSIDGTEPTEEYSAPFALNEAATVKAIAVKDGWNDSEITTASFTIKEEEPEEEGVIKVALTQGVMSGRTRYMSAFSAPYNVQVPSSMKVYMVTKVNGRSVSYTRIYTNKIPANIGVILEGSSATTIQATKIDSYLSTSRYRTNLLKNTANGSVIAGEKCYTFGVNDSNVMKFYLVDEGAEIPKYSAYLDLSGTSINVLSLDFGDDSEVSGIEDVNAEDAEVEYYNLQGVKVENPEKGIYIMKQGGKTSKVVL